MNRRYIMGMLCVFASAVLYGISPTGVVVVYAGGSNPITVSFLRAFICLPVVAWLAFRQPKASRKLTAVQWRDMTLLSMGMAATMFLLTSTYELLGTGMGTTLHFTYPLFTLIFCTVLYRERLRLTSVICVVLCIAGVALCCDLSGGGSTLGTVIALTSGLTFGMYLTFLARCTVSGLPPIIVLFYTHLLISVELFLGALCSGMLALPQTGLSWGVMVLLSFGLTLGATFLLQTGTLMVGAQRASVFSTFEPLTAVLFGGLVLHEGITAKNLVGVVLILAAVILIAMADSRQQKKSASL